MEAVKNAIAKLPIGSDLMVSTSSHSYGGILKAKHESWILIEEANGLRFPVDYTEIYWHSAE
jgi:hypothetical protein